MAVDGGETKKKRVKGSSAINATTGNLISRDASSGRFFIVKTAELASVLPKGNLGKKKSKAGTTAKKTTGGSFKIDKKKAEKAEQVVLSYLNKLEK